MNSVLRACNKMYVSIALKFMREYITQDCTIVDMDRLGKQIKSEIQTQGILGIILEFNEVTDQSALQTS